MKLVLIVKLMLLITLVLQGMQFDVATACYRRGLMQVVPGASNVASSGAGSCNVTLPEKPETLVNVTLSTDCPVNSNGCSGPSDIVPLAILNTLTPCCHAHDWCYVCGPTNDLTGIEGRRSCDEKFKANMLAQCNATYTTADPNLAQCISAAEQMYQVVYLYQEAQKHGLDGSNSSTDCPGEARKLANVDFCFNPVYEKPPEVIATISPGNGGPRGTWAALAECPSGSFASSLATRVQPLQGNITDDTGLNSVRMNCTDRSGTQTTSSPIESDPGRFGDWSSFVECPIGQHVVAVKLSVEPDQASGDDIAADGFRALCSDRVTELDNNSSLGLGVWDEWAYCPDGSAVCGFRLKMEQAAAVDDTAVNDIEIDCCKYLK